MNVISGQLVKAMTSDKLDDLKRLINILSNFEKIVISQQGPAINIEMICNRRVQFILVDLTFSNRCLQWPETSDWLTREETLA